MKRLLLFFALCSSLGAWAQTASFSEPEAGTLRITASGDLTGYSLIDESKKVFTDAAASAVFVDNSGSKSPVGGGQTYDPSKSYYTATQEWFSIEPSNTKYTYSYTINGAWSSSFDKNNHNVYQKTTDGYTKVNMYSLPSNLSENSEEGIGASWYYLKNDDDTYTNITLSDFKTNYYIISSITYYCNSSVMYVSTDGGVTKTQLTQGTQYTYQEGETFYSYSADYAVIEDNATYFAENPSYLKTDPSTMSFTTILANKIKSGSYSKVEFVNTESTQLTINYSIISAILYPNGGNTYNKDIRTLDLGQTTIPGLNTKDFIDNTTNGYYVNNISVTDLTIPLVPADDGQVVVPADVISTWNTNGVATGCLHLTTVRIPEGYTKIGDNAFRNFSYLSNIILPSTLKEIGNNAFENSGAITAMTLNGGLEYIGKSAFVGTKLTYNTENPFSIPSSVKKIDQLAFANVKTITYIQFNEGLEFIGNSAFIADSELQEQLTLVFPKTVKYIGPGAFVGRMYKDVYFTSQTAPICPIGKPLLAAFQLTQCATFSPNLYHGNNGFDADEENGGDDARHHGYANRQNYINGGDFLAFLHFPNGLDDDNRNTYRDTQRIYKTYPAGHTYAYDDPAGFDYNTMNAGGIIVPGASADEPIRTEGTEHTIGGNILPPGFVDTYRGEQYVWPSQPMWARAYIENAFGYQYDGVTKYRPTITAEQIGYMIEDGLVMSDGTTLTDGSIEMTQDQVNAYNATLEDAWNEETIKTPAVCYTQEEADAHNLTIEGHIEAGQSLFYTAAEIKEYNATLDGAVNVGDVKTPAKEEGYLTWAEYLELHPDANGAGGWFNESAYNSNIESVKKGQGAWFPYADYYHAAQPEVLYDEETAAAYNATLEGAYNSETVKGTATAETAAAYNATLEGAWTISTVKEEAVYYTATEINEHNATLTGAKKVNDSMSNLDYYADEISKIAYLGTRQFVFSDPDTDSGTTPDEFKITGVTAENWWTLCVPFNMTKAQIDETFGVGTHVCRLNQIDRDVTSTPKSVKFYFQDDVYVNKSEKNDEGVYARTGTKTTADDIVIYAHEAYMIYPTVKQDEQGTFVVKNYQMVTGAPIPTILNANDGTEYRYVGNYTQEIVSTNANGELTSTTAKIPAYSYMYAKKKGDAAYKFWFTSKTNVTWKPFKCVIQATAKDGGANENWHFFGGADPNATSNTVKQISIFGENADSYNSEETYIERVELIMGEGKDSETIYNINGQMVNQNSLQKGIYIKNGKKYLVK